MPGRLVKRYKRFLADIELADGGTVVAHCANPGSMMGLADPGMKVWLAPVTSPTAKLKYKWELVEADGALVGINTAHPNFLAHEAIQDGVIPGLAGYGSIRREVKYGANSRIDLLLESQDRPPCYVEVKSVTLRRRGQAQFPDSVTARGVKHLSELKMMVNNGARAMMLFIVQRDDCTHFSIADDIDPAYGMALRDALDFGVEVECYGCKMSATNITVYRPLNVMV